MGLLGLLALTVWTIVLMRLAAARATVSDRTLAVYLMAGAAIGLAGQRLLEELVSPYGERSLWIALAANGLRQGALIAPVVVFLFLRRLSLAVSVLDAFLLGFAVGLGFELAGVAVTAGLGATAGPRLTLFPPWRLLGPPHIAGYAYWTGLLALGWAAALRFAPGRRRARIAIAALCAYMLLEQTLLLYPQLTWPAPVAWFGRLFGVLTFQGALTGWLTLAAVVAATYWEGRWAERARQPSYPVPELVAEWSALLPLLVRRRLREYQRLQELFGVRRQAAMAGAQAFHSPTVARLPEAAAALSARAERLRLETPADSPKPVRPPRPVGLRRVFTALPWAALLLLVFVLPRVTFLHNLFWSLPLIHHQIPLAPAELPHTQVSGSISLLSLVLAAVVLWRCVVAAGKPEADRQPDDLLRFGAERVLVWTSVILVVIVTLYGRPEHVFPFTGSISLIGGTGGAPPPNVLGPVLLVFAWAACSLSAGRAERWRLTASTPERCSVALRQALAVAGVFAVAWLTLGVYLPLLTWVHAKWGGKLYGAGVKSLPVLGADGNTLAALIALIPMILLGGGAALVVRFLARRVHEYFFKPAGEVRTP